MTGETHERQRPMTFVVAQQSRGMQHERSTIICTIEARTLADARAMVGAALRLAADAGNVPRGTTNGTRGQP